MKLLRWLAHVSAARALGGVAAGLIAGARSLLNAADRRDAQARKVFDKGDRR